MSSMVMNNIWNLSHPMDLTARTPVTTLEDFEWKTKPIKLVYTTRSIGKGKKTLDEGTSLTTRSMVWHPYHMIHTSTLNYINFPTQGSGHFVLQRGNRPAEVKKSSDFSNVQLVQLCTSLCTWSCHLVEIGGQQFLTSKPLLGIR